MNAAAEIQTIQASQRFSKQLSFSFVEPVFLLPERSEDRSGPLLLKPIYFNVGDSIPLTLVLTVAFLEPASSFVSDL